MNYYLKKRVQNGITKSDMANELGLSYIRYSAIEKGSVKMPSNLIDKFNEIINRGKENEITKIENNIKADKFWNEVKQRTPDGSYVLIKKMHEFNIKSVKDLTTALGYSSSGTIWNYLQERVPAGVEFKKRLYNFFSNELNIQIPSENAEAKARKPKRISTNNPTLDKKLDRFYEKTNFKKIMKENHLNNMIVAQAIGVDNSVISRMTTKTNKPGYKTLLKVKDYFDSIVTDSKQTISNQPVVCESVSVSSNQYISKQKVLDECEKEIEETKLKIEQLQDQIKELNSKIELTSKVADLIKSL